VGVKKGISDGPALIAQAASTAAAKDRAKAGRREQAAGAGAAPVAAVLGHQGRQRHRSAPGSASG
jgi:hypothetical protein